MTQITNQKSLISSTSQTRNLSSSFILNLNISKFKNVPKSSAKGKSIAISQTSFGYQRLRWPWLWIRRGGSRMAGPRSGKESNDGDRGCESVVVDPQWLDLGQGRKVTIFSVRNPRWNEFFGKESNEFFYLSQVKRRYKEEEIYGEWDILSETAAFWRSKKETKKKRNDAVLFIFGVWPGANIIFLFPDRWRGLTNFNWHLIVGYLSKLWHLFGFISSFVLMMEKTLAGIRFALLPRPSHGKGK